MIRSARLEDTSSLAAVAIEVWLNTYIRNGVNAFFADYALNQFTKKRFEEALSSNEGNIWVSENSNGIDGFIHIVTNSEPPVADCSDLEISTLYVQPRHQGFGAGGDFSQPDCNFVNPQDDPMFGLRQMPKTHVLRIFTREGASQKSETRISISKTNATPPIFCNTELAILHLTRKSASDRIAKFYNIAKYDL